MNTKNKNLALFFIGSLLWTWIFYFPIGIFGLNWSSGIGLVLFILGGPGPTLAGLWLVFRTYSREERKEYFRRCLDFKSLGWKWSLAPVLIFAGITALSLLIDGVFAGNPLPEMSWLKYLLANPLYLFVFIPLSLISGPLNEEFGWRGVGLDPLIEKFGFVKGAAILGAVWAIWHLPWYLMPGQAQYELGFTLTGVGFYILYLIALSIIVAWIYRGAQRSIVSALLAHMCANFFPSQLMSPYASHFQSTVFWVTIIIGLGLAAVITISRKANRSMI